jgi:GTP-binding protein
LPWSRTEADAPRIVILGRTNTGKSTLFNRLLMKRRAITDPTPGVTRDPVEAVWSVNGRSAVLVDTGGFSLEADDLQRLVREKTLAWLRQADLVLFVIDVEGLTQEDEELLHQLQPFRDKVILVANKTDTAQKELLLYEQHRLGFQRLVGVSAEHGRNIPALLREIDAFFRERAGGPPGAERPSAAELSLALLGRPNTGKSTLLNAILGMEKSIVSDVPGTTRDVVEGFFTFRTKALRILDTAGIRRKNRIENALEYYSVNRAIRTIEESDVVVLLIDALSELSEQDKKIAGLVLKRGKGLVLCLNKWDLVEKIPNRLRAVKDRIEFLFPAAEHLPVIPVSAKTGEGIERLLATALKVNEEMDKRVDTGELNRALEAWKEKFAIPLKKNTRIRYMTQTDTRPARFVLFVNARRGFPRTYLQYLKNRLREDFGFRHVPIQIEVRKAAKSGP